MITMYIRTQDKKKLLRFIDVRVDEWKDGKDNKIFITDYNDETLGVYDTEKRALEVLEEINDYKDKLEKSYFLGMTETNFVSSTFEMPKE